MGSLGPNRWSVTFSATINPTESGCEIQMEWVVSTFGQIGTKVDIEFWRSEVEMTMAASVGRKSDPRDHSKLGARAYNGNVWRALVFTVALVVPWIVSAYATNNMWTGLAVGTICCTVCGFAFRMPRTLGTVDLPREIVAPPVSGR